MHMSWWMSIIFTDVWMNAYMMQKEYVMPNVCISHVRCWMSSSACSKVVVDWILLLSLQDVWTMDGPTTPMIEKVRIDDYSTYSFVLIKIRGPALDSRSLEGSEDLALVYPDFASCLYACRNDFLNVRQWVLAYPFAKERVLSWLGLDHALSWL